MQTIHVGHISPTFTRKRRVNCWSTLASWIVWDKTLHIEPVEPRRLSRPPPGGQQSKPTWTLETPWKMVYGEFPALWVVQGSRYEHCSKSAFSPPGKNTSMSSNDRFSNEEPPTPSRGVFGFLFTRPQKRHTNIDPNTSSGGRSGGRSGARSWSRIAGPEAQNGVAFVDAVHGEPLGRGAQRFPEGIKETRSNACGSKKTQLGQTAGSSLPFYLHFGPPPSTPIFSPLEIGFCTWKGGTCDHLNPQTTPPL